MTVRNLFSHAAPVIASMSPHPNVLSRPHKLAIATDPRDKLQLLPVAHSILLARGTLNDQVTNAKKKGQCLNIQDKWRWCLQMVSVIALMHHIALTVHMEIKPANFLVDDDGNTILVDWEQSGAPL